MFLVLRQSMWPVLLGAIAGLGGIAAVSGILTSMLYGISPHDPIAFLSVTAFFLAVASLASYIPARRAMRVDPTVALRHE
jgi:ABC-type antimicrobial peptide transport system permease subunit